MPELVLELFSEEIPARMQARAAGDLQRLVNERLLSAGFLPEGVKAFAGPRRLALVAAGLPLRQPDRKDEKKGPRVGAPDKAALGFLKSAGLSSLDQCEVREDKKGQYYVALIEEKGRDTADVIAGFMPELVAGFPWPKSMRWGAGDLRWVRPLHSILCCFDGEVVEFEAGGVRSSDVTYGHRFMAPGEIRVRSFETYRAALKRAHVILDAGERNALIAGEAKTLAEAQGLELVEDAGLLNEVSGLAEWPVVMIGAFDEKFLALPDEVLTATMRGHQKYFSVRDPKTGRLANKFIFVANIEAKGGGAAMRAGYERVLTARLSDAWYLYRQDLKVPLDDLAKKLIDVQFSSVIVEKQAEIRQQLQAPNVDYIASISSIHHKQSGVAELAKEISRYFRADEALVERAAYIAKADLVTGMVYEFPELQGTMGRYYALQHDEPAEVADAIRDHYRPLGSEDVPPTAPVSACLAVADKLQTLAAFFGAQEEPTGSRDPYGLRRMCLGVVRTVLTGEFRLPLDEVLKRAAVYGGFQGNFTHVPDRGDFWERIRSIEASIAFRLLAFFHDRLKVYLRDKGHRYDAIDAVLAKADGMPEDDLVLIVRKLEALEAFLKTDDGANLAVAFKRAANILKAEEKTDGKLADPAAVDAKKFAQAEEKALYAALEAAEAKARAAVAAEQFEDAMTALASLRKPIDAFFDAVTVNADDPALRANRLALLARFRAATAAVADLSKLEG